MSKKFDPLKPVKTFQILDINENIPCEAFKKMSSEVRAIFKCVIIGPPDKNTLFNASGQIYGFFSREEHADRFLKMLNVRKRMGLPDNERME